MAGYSGERFSYTDPFDKQAINRTTRYRAKKRRLEEDRAGSVEQPEFEGNSDSTSRDSHDSETPVADAEGMSEDSLRGYSRPEDDHSCVGNVSACQMESSCGFPPLCETELDFEPGTGHIESDDEVENIPVSRKIYEGSSLTIAASSVLLMKFRMRHNLSNEGLHDLLQLVKLHCPTPNN